MDQNRQTVKLLRHLDAESAMLEQLQVVCEGVSQMVQQTRDRRTEPLDFSPAQHGFEKFVEQADTVLKRRAKLLDDINIGREQSDRVSIRQFIQRSTSPMRSQLERKRGLLIDKMYKIKTQMAGDSAAIYYTFDFYRRIINGLVNVVSEEQNYNQDGKSAQNSSGRLIEKEC